MVEIPENPISKELLSSWYTMAKELKVLRAKEILLRKQIFGHAFPNPHEGTNNFDLDDGYVLKGTYSLDRSVDEGAFSSLKEKLREEAINPDKLVQWKPSLVRKEYNKLTEDQKHLFDQCLTMKPGSPSLEIVLPAKNKPKD
jgi:hypothetical protein